MSVRVLHSSHPGRLWGDGLPRPHTQRSLQPVCSTPPDDPALHSRRPLCLLGHRCTLSLRAHKPSSDNMPGRGTPTHPPALPIAQAVSCGRALGPNNLRRLGRPRSPTQAPARVTDDRPPSLTCDNMTTRHKPTPHFREPQQRSCYVIGLCSQRHAHTRKQLRGREQLPGPEGSRRVHTARAGLHSGRGGKTGSTRRTRAVEGRVFGRDQATKAL